MIESKVRGFVYLVVAGLLLLMSLSTGGGLTAQTALASEQMVGTATMLSSFSSEIEQQGSASNREADLLQRWDALLVKQRGAAYRRSQVVRHSRYLDPVSTDGELRGRSRIWGDAALDVQAECIERLVRELQASDFSQDEICFALALVRCESGFNPDAAAGISSACGLGQFLDKTRTVLCDRAGIENADPFCVDLNIVCLRETLKECFRFARKRASRDTMDYFAYAYAYHHDGPRLNAGGLEIGRSKVLPWLETAKRCIRSQ